MGNKYLDSISGFFTLGNQTGLTLLLLSSHRRILFNQLLAPKEKENKDAQTYAKNNHAGSLNIKTAHAKAVEPARKIPVAAAIKSQKRSIDPRKKHGKNSENKQ